MTNDQKLVYLIHATDELIKAQEKADAPNAGIILKDAARQKRNQLKIWLAGNKLVIGSNAPVARKKASYKNTHTTQHNRWLGQ